MFLFIICPNAKFTGNASNRFYRPVIQFILNDTGFHILNDTMAALLIKSGNQFTVFFADRNAYFIAITPWIFHRSEEHTSELQSRGHLVCRLLLEKKKKIKTRMQVSSEKRRVYSGQRSLRHSMVDTQIT